MAKKNDINFDRLDDLTPIKKKKSSEGLKKKKVRRKPLTHTFSEETIKLMKRMKYWDRYDSDSQVIEKAIQALASGKTYQPTPEEEQEGN
ncbi:hypothetical protein [uncultured Microscilla sp.]|uniref:hypothetical protein n=1 Tax=uncultured Microscilla sp. TaxID=432653 RepID=UPI00262759FA|nr:hypothetical protein [uncultured Microscilla sp.]